MPTAGHPHTLELDAGLDLLAVHRSDPDRWPYLLSSTAPGGTLGRYSLLLFQLGDAFGIPSSRSAGRIQPEPGFFEQLAALPLSTASGDSSPWPFVGGWFVYLAYEVVATIEPRLQLPAADDDLPIAWVARCPAALILDHQSRRLTLLAETVELLDRARQALADKTSADCGDRPLPSLELSSEAGERFKQGVERIREWIRAGDVFQVNLSRGWRGQARSEIDPATVYRALAASNPSPFAGLARLPGGTIVSSSPERLVEVRDGIAQTRPIAGTRPRGHDEESDASLSAELMAHPKERAEHIMLIDLERNDLGRVCQPGSVEVDELMVIESYAHVHHIVSNIRGRIRPDVDPAQIIRATFPGGTITGCPKVRCMEIIAELEGQGRSFYTGSMGYIGRNGHLDLNILIRSLSISGRTLKFRTGAGIVADSDPETELAETEAKARGLLRALQPT
jgi:anthranilate synthase component 1